MHRALLALLLPLTAVTAGACGDLRDAYGKEYVLYDSHGSPAAGAAAQAGPTQADPTPAAPTSETGKRTAAPTDAASTFARILLLEQVRGELEQAILAGLDSDGALARKRREVEEELQGRIQVAGTQLDGWRAQRARELAQFVIVR
ncbi:MAG: hypothetical protein R3F56_06360 [Planctomycetota bacterium]